MDDIEKLKDTSLPPINEFYSNLTDSNISTSDYQHAQDVWDKTLKNYVNVYLNLDVPPSGRYIPTVEICTFRIV